MSVDHNGDSDAPVPDIETVTFVSDLDEPGTVKRARLAEVTDIDYVDEMLRAAVLDHLEQMWKNRDQIRAQYEQRQERQQAGE